MTCCLLEKAESEWGAPPSRAIRTPRIFPRIFCVFLRDSGTPIFQAPKRRRKICGKSAQKWAQESAHQKSAQKWAQKSAHQKSAQKWAQKWPQKSAHQKSAQKNRFEHSVCLEDGSQKKKHTHTHKENVRQTCAKHKPR